METGAKGSGASAHRWIEEMKEIHVESVQFDGGEVSYRHAIRFAENKIIYLVRAIAKTNWRRRPLYCEGSCDRRKASVEVSG